MPIFARLKVQAEDFAGLVATVESCAGLGSSSAFFNQRTHDVRYAKLLVSRIVRERLPEVVHDLNSDIQADYIGQAKRPRPWAADESPGEVIHLFDGHSAMAGDLQRLNERVHSQPCGDEAGGILRANHALSQYSACEMCERFEQLRIGLGGGNQLDRLHVARWVEEVSSQEPPPERWGAV